MSLSFLADFFQKAKSQSAVQHRHTLTRLLPGVLMRQPFGRVHPSGGPCEAWRISGAPLQLLCACLSKASLHKAADNRRAPRKSPNAAQPARGMHPSKRRPLNAPLTENQSHQYISSKTLSLLPPLSSSALQPRWAATSAHIVSLYRSSCKIHPGTFSPSSHPSPQIPNR